MENSLAHYGVKGQKWGIRRFQNKDGTFTAAGKKRYEKEMAKLKAEEKVLKNKLATQAKIDKLNKKRQDIDDQKKQLEPANKKSTPVKVASGENRSKSVKDYSDQELQQIVNRLNLEQRYNQLNPEKVSLGKKIFTTIGKDILLPATVEVGKNLAKNLLQDMADTSVKKLSTGSVKKKLKVVKPKKK